MSKVFSRSNIVKRNEIFVIVNEFLHVKCVKNTSEMIRRRDDADQREREDEIS